MTPLCGLNHRSTFPAPHPRPPPTAWHATPHSGEWTEQATGRPLRWRDFRQWGAEERARPSQHLRASYSDGVRGLGPASSSGLPPQGGIMTASHPPLLTPAPSEATTVVQGRGARSQREIKTLPSPALSTLNIKAHQISFSSCMWSRCQTGRLLSASLRGSHCSAGPPGSLGRVWAEATHSPLGARAGVGGIISPIGCKMPGPLLVCNLPYLPGPSSIASTLLSLEVEAGLPGHPLAVSHHPWCTGQGEIRSAAIEVIVHRDFSS